MTRRPLGRWLVGASLIAPLLGVGACCFDRHNETIALTDAVPPCGSELYFEWNGVTELPPGYFPFVGKSDGGSEDEPVLELFDAAGARTPLPWTVLENQQCYMGCPRTVAAYSLDGLEAGDYTLVHRRRFGGGEMLIVEPGAFTIPWAEWDGEEALVTTLRIR